MNPSVYRVCVLGTMRLPRAGGPELLLPDIAASLYFGDSFAGSERPRHLWIPFASSGALKPYVRRVYPTMEVTEGGLWPASLPDAIYFGTPTMVKDRPLFPEDARGTEAEGWGTEDEREWVRTTCALAQARGVRLILSGLGSGDIAPEDRIADMGGGRVVVVKHFDGFTDWLLRRDIK